MASVCEGIKVVDGRETEVKENVMQSGVLLCVTTNIKLFLSVYTCHAHTLALTKCRVHFDWKRNMVFSSACNCHVKGFQTGPLKVTR